MPSQSDRQPGRVNGFLDGAALREHLAGEQVGEYRHFDERLTMFLLRSRRPARYGKSIEQAPAPDDREWDRRIALGDALMEIAIAAPVKHGNPVEDWNADEDEAE